MRSAFEKVTVARVAHAGGEADRVLSTTLTLRREPVRVEEDEQTDGAVALVIAIRSARAGRL